VAGPSGFETGSLGAQYSRGTGLRSRAKIGSPSVGVKNHQPTDSYLIIDCFIIGLLLQMAECFNNDTVGAPV